MDGSIWVPQWVPKWVPKWAPKWILNKSPSPTDPWRQLKHIRCFLVATNNIRKVTLKITLKVTLKLALKVSLKVTLKI